MKEDSGRKYAREICTVCSIITQLKFRKIELNRNVGHLKMVVHISGVISTYTELDKNSEISILHQNYLANA